MEREQTVKSRMLSENRARGVTNHVENELTLDIGLCRATATATYALVRPKIAADSARREIYLEPSVVSMTGRRLWRASHTPILEVPLLEHTELHEKRTAGATEQDEEGSVVLGTKKASPADDLTQRDFVGTRKQRRPDG